MQQIKKFFDFAIFHSTLNANLSHILMLNDKRKVDYNDKVLPRGLTYEQN
jgi:hypothetical protein